MTFLKLGLLLFALFFLLPLGVSAALYLREGTGAGWRTADRSSVGHLPPASRNPQAVVRVFAAQLYRPALPVTRFPQLPGQGRCDGWEQVNDNADRYYSPEWPTRRG
jgi:hypothetical protein